jgi:hypothetical protein
MKRKISMTQKDLNDLCTAVSILTQCNSLFETLEIDNDANWASFCADVETRLATVGPAR